MLTTHRSETSLVTLHGDLAQRPPRPLSPRQARVLTALLQGPRTREQIDRTAGASNGPDEVMQLRRRFGLLIPCTRKGSLDMDGHRVEVGIYHLTDADQANARRLLAQVHTGRTEA